MELKLMRISRGIAILVTAVCMAAPTVHSQTPYRGGEIFDVQIEAGFTETESVSEEVHYPGASLIMVHFLHLELAPGVELTVSDLDKSVVHSYPGAAFTKDDLDGQWALGVPGDTAIIQLRVVDPGSGVNLADSGFIIDKVGWGYPEMMSESVCGTDDRQDVECYSATHPTEMERARAVARHVRTENPWIYFCTAWRVGSGPHMFTNEHCLESQEWLDASAFWFNYERTGCDSGGNKSPRVVGGDELLIRHGIYDFALFTITNPAYVAEFGFLEIDPRIPVQGEEIYMAGHPDGAPKIFALESDMNTSGLCEVDAAVHPLLGGREMGYFCDTSGGQSGSPVLARSNHKVIALHHAGYDPCNASRLNAGVRMDRIWPLVEGYIGPVFDDGFESGDTAGWTDTVP